MAAEPPPGVMLEALRQVRATLAGEPVQAVAPEYTQGVIWAMAALAADAVTTSCAATLGIQEDEAKAKALSYLDIQISRLVLSEDPWRPGDPLPPQDPGAA